MPYPLAFIIPCPLTYFSFIRTLTLAFCNMGHTSKSISRSNDRAPCLGKGEACSPLSTQIEPVSDAPHQKRAEFVDFFENMSLQFGKRQEPPMPSGPSGQSDRRNCYSQLLRYPLFVI